MHAFGCLFDLSLFQDQKADPGTRISGFSECLWRQFVSTFSVSASVLAYRDLYWSRPNCGLLYFRIPPFEDHSEKGKDSEDAQNLASCLTSIYPQFPGSGQFVDFPLQLGAFFLRRKLEVFWLSLFKLSSKRGFMKGLRAKTLILLGVLFVLLYALVLAQKEKLSRARIFFPDTRWDFGYVPQGGPVSHVFQVKNIGEDTLIIVRVRPGCACTMVPLTKDRLAPGETADLEVIFDSEKIRQGKTTKSVQITSNDPTKPFQDLQFTARVRETNSLVKLTPQEVRFDTIVLTNEAQRKLTVENISKEELSMKLIGEPKEFVKLKLEKRSLKPGEKTEITLGLKKGAPLGAFRTSLTLNFQNSKMVRVSVPVYGVVTAK